MAKTKGQISLENCIRELETLKKHVDETRAAKMRGEDEWEKIESGFKKAELLVKNAREQCRLDLKMQQDEQKERMQKEKKLKERIENDTKRAILESKKEGKKRQEKPPKDMGNTNHDKRLPNRAKGVRFEFGPPECEENEERRDPRVIAALAAYNAADLALQTEEQRFMEDKSRYSYERVTEAREGVIRQAQNYTDVLRAAKVAKMI